MIILACKRCHEKDRDATGCTETTAQHIEKIQIYGSKCDICGASECAVLCRKYPGNKKKLGAEPNKRQEE